MNALTSYSRILPLAPVPLIEFISILLFFIKPRTKGVASIEPATD